MSSPDLHRESSTPQDAYGGVYDQWPSTRKSLIVMIVGPIDYWWNENWHTKPHLDYILWRNEVNTKLVEAGHLVYRPHEAFKGAWNEHAQDVNVAAISVADCLVNIRPPGIPAYGTEAEIEIARLLAVPVVSAPPGTDLRLLHVLVPGPVYLFDPLDDPYGKVHRKSYMKPKP